MGLRNAAVRLQRGDWADLGKGDAAFMEAKRSMPHAQQPQRWMEVLKARRRRKPDCTGHTACEARVRCVRIRYAWGGLARHGLPQAWPYSGAASGDRL